jgi:hypothetical protein
VEVPLDVHAVFGLRGPVKVRARFDEVTCRGSLAPLGGEKHALGITKAIRRDIGKDIGDTVRVTIERDTEERTVELPDELAAALRDTPDAAARYTELSFTHRREYAQWVGEAKKQETRGRRAARTIERLLGPDAKQGR